MQAHQALQRRRKWSQRPSPPQYSAPAAQSAMARARGPWHWHPKRSRLAHTCRPRVNRGAVTLRDEQSILLKFCNRRSARPAGRQWGSVTFLPVGTRTASWILTPTPSGVLARAGTGLADLDRPRVVEQPRDLVRRVEELGHWRTGHAGGEIRRASQMESAPSPHPTSSARPGSRPATSATSWGFWLPLQNCREER
jgi:hypothetical protein